MKSFCHLCLAECGLRVETSGNRITKVLPDPSDPISQGYVCEKAQRLDELQNSPDRITSPLKKVDNTFVKISWPQALEEIADRLALADKSILYMAPLSPTYFFNTVFNLKLMNQMGVEYITDVTSVEKIDHIMAQGEVFQAGLTPDRNLAETLLIVGKNSWVTNHHPRARIIINQISNDPARQLIVVDPVTTETARRADIHIKLLPGTDVWFLKALAKTVVDLTANNTLIANYRQVVQQFSTVDVAECLAICGISQQQLQQVAERIASTSTSVDIENGIDHTPNSFNAHYLISMIILLTGNISKPGAMQISARFATSEYFRKPTTPVTGHRQYLGAIPGSVVSDNLNFKAVIIDNCNPADRLPNTNQFVNRLKDVDLVVALDSFTTSTTELADYVLPTPTFHERHEIVNVLNKNEAVLQLSKPVIPCPDYARTSSAIYSELMERMGLATQTKGCYNTTVESARDQLRAYYQRNLAISNEEIELHVDQEIVTLVETGKLEYEKFYLKDKQYYINPQRLADILNVQVNTDSSYPYILACGVRNNNTLNNLLPQPMESVEVNSSLGLEDGSIATLTTEIHQESVSVVINNNLPNGYIRLTNSLGINKFTGNQGDGNPWYKYVRAKLNK